MGRQPCCDKVGLKKGPWTAEEDQKLVSFILGNAHCCWRAVPKLAGLLRCGKSCRLRWTNYLRPDLKRGLLSDAEEKIVIDLHAQIGNRWSKIASLLPGRTDNEIKNHWNTHIKKKLRKMGIDPLTHESLPSPPPPQPTSGGSLEAPQPSPPPERKPPEEIPAPVTTTETETETSQHLQQGDDEAELLLSDSPGFCTDEVPMMHPDEIMVPLGAQPPPLPPASVTVSTPTTSYSTASASSSSLSRGEEALFPPFVDMDFQFQFPESALHSPSPIITGLDDDVYGAKWGDCSVQPPLSPSLVYEDLFHTSYQFVQRNGAAFDQQEAWNKTELFSGY